MTVQQRLVRRQRRTRYGFTLIELMIAIVVSSIVVLGVFAFSQIQQSTAALHERDVRVQQALEGAMWAMGRDVRAAGFGFARQCTELRVWSNSQNKLINPGGTTPANAYLDDDTNEPYWVLRDGLQGHWSSANAADWDGGGDASSVDGSAADSFDVILAEPGYVQGQGMFSLTSQIGNNDVVVNISSSTNLDGTSSAEAKLAVQQMFPPGTFFLIAQPPDGLPFDVGSQGQCVLLQSTGDVVATGAGGWQIPIGLNSQFNANKAELFDEEPDPVVEFPAEYPTDDWDPAVVNAAGAQVLPLGRLRWSRYEIDYTVPSLPYLVRKDLIGFQEDEDPGNLGGAVDYPWCDGGECPMPGLHLPGTNSPPAAVAVGPLVEDMQVVMGCDGYTAAAAQQATDAGTKIAPPETTPQDYGEKGPGAGPNAGVANAVVDENAPGNNDNQDEWVGNADETWAPDCVWYGTGQYFAPQWAAVEGNVAPGFRLSPQTMRVTLVAAAETEAAGGGVASTTVPALEDRPEMTSIIPGRRERFTLTERFTPPNLRWRDPFVE